MKVVILQSMYDSLGGIYYVNKELMKMFHEEKYDIHLVSVRMSGYYQEVEYPKYINNIIVNDKAEWGTTRYSTIFNELKKFKILKTIKLLYKRFKEDITLKVDYERTKRVIKKIKPDFIINSHYELLDAIPKEYLKKTIMHFHTNFGIVKENFSYKRIFNKYKDKIFKFVWLTKKTKEEAIEFGYKNSISIYNSVRIKSDEVADVINNKNLIFLGRISKEKRIDIILKIFNEISLEKKDWTLSIYGIGNLKEEEQNIIANNDRITYYGSTNNLKEVFMKSSININTSDFEGFSMTVLEANEFGVPTIAFEFGESVYEEIISNKTGIIVEKNNINKYKEELIRIMDNPNILKKLSLNCKEFNKNFSYNIIKKDWINLLNKKN